MEEIIEIIRQGDNQEILNYCLNLSDSERYKNIDFLKNINIDADMIKADGNKLQGQERATFYEKRGEIYTSLHFAMVACTRNYEDIKKLESTVNTWIHKPFMYFLAAPNYELLLEFYEHFPPDYLNKVILEISKERFWGIDFKTLWKLYEKGWVIFDEQFFLNSLITIRMFGRNTETDATFLFENQAALEKVFLKFYQYDLPVLDISKWQAREGFVCKKVYEFWTEVIVILIEKGYYFDRIIVKNLLESLLNNWKKPRLDWHTRLIEILEPTEEEYLTNQSLLFATLGTDQVSLINFSIRNIKAISHLDDFNELGFLERFVQTFSNEKCVKSIQTGLSIVESILSKPQHKNFDYNDSLAILLMQSDAKLQEQTALMMLKFGDKDNLKTIISPYIPYFKQKTKEPFTVNEEITEETNIESEEKELKTVIIPTSWDALLFQIGNCINSKSALDIDIFLEGLNQLQNEIPNDYERQLKPYSKQLSGRIWENDVMRIFANFIECWINKSNRISKAQFKRMLPFLENKCNQLLEKLKSNNKLPFLSTPSHEPFYIHPNILINRLLAYQERQKEVDFVDLIVACNRLLFLKTDEKSITLAKKLTGKYAPAIHFFLGISDKILPTEDTLPLWTQIVRIKNPDAIYTEFEQTRAKDYPSVSKPFYIEFEINNKYDNWNRMVLENNWNASWLTNKFVVKYNPFYFNIDNSFKVTRIDIPYQLSLNPQYLDAQLCKYIPDTSSGNEVNGFEDCLFPLQFLLENDLKIYHSGWIYVAVCFLFEKKISRELASEYVQISLLQRNQSLDYFADTVGKLIAKKYAPINRLLEFIDKPTTEKRVKLLKFSILEKCIEYLDLQDLPINSKKIFTEYLELSNSLKIKVSVEFSLKMNSAKK